MLIARQFTRGSIFVVTLAGLIGASVAGAKVVERFSLADASGPIKSAGEKVISSTNALTAAADYAQAGPPAGKYGEFTLTAAEAAGIKSAHFDGKVKLDLGSAKGSPLNVTGNFTVSAWVKFDDTDGYHTIFATGAGSGNGWKFGASGGSFVITANGVADVTLDDQPLDSGKWMFVAITVAGEKGERKINFYVNGKKVNADPLTADDINKSDAEHMYIGGADNAANADENFIGNLADLKISDTVLDASAIKAAAIPAK